MTHDDFDAFAPRPRSRSQQPHTDAPTVSFNRPDYDSPVRYEVGPDQSRDHVGQHSDPYEPDDPGPPRRGGRHWFWVIGAVVIALIGVTAVTLVLGGLTDPGPARSRAGGESAAGQSPTGPGAAFPSGVRSPAAPAPGAPGRGGSGAPGASGAAPGAPGAAPGATGAQPGGSGAGGTAAGGGGGPVVQHPKPTGNQRAIPNVVGLRTNDALRTLRASGFRAGALFIAVDNRAQVGMVLRQSPDAGAPLDRGLGVTVLVGAGK
jgi:PASTA domain